VVKMVIRLFFIPRVIIQVALNLTGILATL